MSRVFKTKENQITQKYKKGTHNGIDLVGYKNSLDYIIAHTGGTVISSRSTYKTNDKSGNSYGNYVKIKHSNGYCTLYAHLKYGSVTVKNGDKVTKGQVIGYMGNTGHSYGSHLHFEVWKDDNRIDPTPYINADLPSPTKTITYQVYDNNKKKWLPNVKSGTNEYAGNLGNSIGGVYIDNVTYRVYDNKKKKWLPWVTGRKDYAGNLDNAIGGIQIKDKTYRVYDNVKKKWLPWVTGTSDYAGNLGNNIGGIQIK